MFRRFTVSRFSRFALFATFAVLWLSGCGKSDLPTTAARPTVKAWLPVTGDSMQPTFPSGCLVEAEFGVPFESLTARDTVIFWDYTASRLTPGASRLLHHRLVQAQAGNWIAKGDNLATNPVADWPWVTPDNYIARTTGRYTYLLTAAP